MSLYFRICAASFLLAWTANVACLAAESSDLWELAKTTHRVPVLVTDGLTQRLEGGTPLDAPNVHVVPVKGDPKSLLELPQADLDAIRRPLLKPFDRTFKAPNRVALYLFDEGSWVVENFRDQPATVQLGDVDMEVTARGWRYDWNQEPVGRKAK